MLQMSGGLLNALLPFFLLEMNGTWDVGKDMVFEDSERHCCGDERSANGGCRLSFKEERSKRYLEAQLILQHPGWRASEAIIHCGLSCGMLALFLAAAPDA